MNPIKITKNVKSLQKATEIIDEIFSHPPVQLETPYEWNKWNKWFQIQKEKFFSKQIGIQTYFAQIKRIQQYFLDKTILSIDELFEIETENREKRYNSCVIQNSTQYKLTKTEIIDLINVLFNQLTKEPSKLKKNTKVELLVQKKRTERFGRELLDNYEEIKKIESGVIDFQNRDQKLSQLGELFLELGYLEEAQENFNKILNEKLKRTMLIWFSILKEDRSEFQNNFLQAFPETFEPKIAGKYFLSFLIGNERNFRYEVDSNNNRCIIYFLNTGIYSFSNLEIFEAFLDDLQVSHDGRLATWVIPTKKENQFKTENITKLQFKQIF